MLESAGGLGEGKRADEGTEECMAEAQRGAEGKQRGPDSPAACSGGVEVAVFLMMSYNTDAAANLLFQ